MSVLENLELGGGEDAHINSRSRPRLRTRASAKAELNMDQGDHESEEEDEENDIEIMNTPARYRSSSRHRVNDFEEHAGTEEDTGEQPSRYQFRRHRSKPERFEPEQFHTMYEDTMQAYIFEPKKKRMRRNKLSTRSKKKRRVEMDFDDSDQSDFESYAQATKEYVPPRHNRATRYALRYREGDAAPSHSISDTGNDTDKNESQLSQERRKARRSRFQRREEDSNEDVERHDEEEEEEGEESRQDDDAEGEDGSRRYSLRTRIRTVQKDYSPHHERPQRSAAAREHDRMVIERRARARARAARFETDTQDATPDESSSFLNESERRYSLRDRSKVQRSESTHEQQAEYNAYADYNKRRSGQAGFGGGNSGKSRHPFFSANGSRRGRRYSRNEDRPRTHDRSSRRRRRRRSGSPLSSSGSSSSDLYKYDDDSDEGGMRRSNRGGVARHGKAGNKSRADITPVEVDRSITWESVGGLEKHIEALKEMVMLPLLYPEFYDKYHITPPSGVLFYGPPGTGKTLLARALANSCTLHTPPSAISDALESGDTQPPARQVTFYMRKGADCLSKWVGEAERQLRLLFEEAKRNQPSIIFFDEIDGLAPVRSAKQDQIHASIVSTLLALMDGLDSRGRVVVIGATNRLDAIDPALRRPGRFDRELGFKLPNVQERKRMLEIHSSKWKPTLSEPFMKELAERTVGYCGADIKALCAEAALCSLRRVYPQVYKSQQKLLIQLERVVVSRADFAKAIKKITPASHRSTSSFAAPLARNVRLLLEDPLEKILKTIAERFPLFPMDIKSIMNDVEDHEEQQEEDEEDIYAMLNHDDCDVCHGDEGELVLCDSCPGAFHVGCLPSMEHQPLEEGEWACPECQKENKTSKKKRSSSAALPLQHMGFPRVLITGQDGMGQHSVGAGILHALEGMSHFSLDYPSLVADVNAHHVEEALVKRLTEAQKCLPCVLFLPQADLWWQNTSESMHLALKMMLLNMQIKANLPVLFLAFASTPLEQLPLALRQLFQDHPKTSVLYALTRPSDASRRAHFLQVFTSFASPPVRTFQKNKSKQEEKLQVLPFAPLPKPKKYTMEELKSMRERDLHYVRELRIFLGQVLDYCASQKQYAPFHYPVDPEEVADYYLIVENPIDLSTMREKLNDGDYTSFDQFLDDVQLIVRNANIFNPKRSATRHIAHAAGTMKDNILSFAHRFRKQQGYDLFEKCRQVTKRLHEHPQLYHQSASPKQKTVDGVVQLRSSARLRGIKAPEPLELCTTRRSEKSADNDAMDVEQWFEEDTKNESVPSAEEVQCDDSSESSSEVEILEKPQEEEEEVVFEKGDHVFVQARTTPGINKLGGAGIILQRHPDNSYHVKYILGGSEKFVDAQYISRLTESSVKESVKNQRSKSNGEETCIKKPQTEEEMKTDFFNSLVWPILEEEGFQRTEEVNEDGKRTLLFFPPEQLVQEFIKKPKKQQTQEEEEEVVVIEGVENALKFVKAHEHLAIKCFGKRYVEELQAQVALKNRDEEEEESNKRESEAQEVQVVSSVDKSIEEEEDDEKEEEEQDGGEKPEEPPFVYDSVRMEKALEMLVQKTKYWTIEELRDELLVLNKLAFTFRHQFDRSELVKQVEEHVHSLNSPN